MNKEEVIKIFTKINMCDNMLIPNVLCDLECKKCECHVDEIDRAYAIDQVLGWLEPKKVKSFSENGYYKCPNCGNNVDVRNHQSYCEECGQALSWIGAEK